MSFPKILDGFHGMWLYDMQDNLVSYGFVTLLDAENPNCDPHLEAQKFKTNPWMKWLLEDAELVRYGAKTIPTGGLYSQPKLYCDGAMLVGDSASMCNAQNLAGIHMAIKSGMLAAETITEALAQQDFTSKTLGGYAERYRKSWAYEEHYQARNFGPSAERGIEFFMLNEPIRMITGRPRPAGQHGCPRRPREHEEALRALREGAGEGRLRVRRQAHVHQGAPGRLQWHPARSGSALAPGGGGHRPLRRRLLPGVRESRARTSARPPSTRWSRTRTTPGRQKLFIHHENCVHCKTCDIADPYQVITWTPPEGGEGPDYTNM